MKLRTILLGLDFAIQEIIILITLFCLAGGWLFREAPLAVLAIVGLAVTGIWQMGSVFLKAALIGRRWHIAYLFSAFAYIFSIWVATSLIEAPSGYDFFARRGFWVFFPVIPSFAALACLYLSFQEFWTEKEDQKTDFV